MRRGWFRAVAACALGLAVLLLARGCCAAGERSQRFAVTLANMAIDVRLLGQKGLNPRQGARLRAKLFSAVGVLGLLGRERLQERREDDPRLLAQITRLQSDFRHGDGQAFAAELQSLGRHYPVDTAAILPLTTRPAPLRHGRRLYQSLCLGCHADSDPGAAVPAPDLFAMARSLSPAELVARLIGGVRGTPATTLDNPLSRQDIAALASYLAHPGPSGTPPAEPALPKRRNP